MHFAARFGYSDTMKTLLEAGANLEAQNNDG